MQTVKRHFFAMRNGIIADVLRRGGSPFKIIFGLNLPQIVEIASATPQQRELACRLWENTSTRESMLIAPMIMPRESFTIDDARTWTAQCPCFEVADILCHRLLRHLPFALDLVKEFLGSENEMTRYAGVRLACNIRHLHPTVGDIVKESLSLSAKDDAANRLAESMF